jgi:hypothetical protein
VEWWSDGVMEQSINVMERVIMACVCVCDTGKPVSRYGAETAVAHVIQPTAYSVQRTAYSLQHTAYSIQHTACSIQPTAYNIQHTAYSVQRTAYNIQLTAYSIKRTACTHLINRSDLKPQ